MGKTGGHWRDVRLSALHYEIRMELDAEYRSGVFNQVVCMKKRLGVDPP